MVRVTPISWNLTLTQITVRVRSPAMPLLILDIVGVLRLLPRLLQLQAAGVYLLRHLLHQSMLLNHLPYSSSQIVSVLLTRIMNQKVTLLSFPISSPFYSLYHHLRHRQSHRRHHCHHHHCCHIVADSCRAPPWWYYRLHRVAVPKWCLCY